MRYCFYWSKIQNLKANHNAIRGWLAFRFIAFTGQRYKIWKQITTFNHLGISVEILLLLVKDTKFESKSQPKRNTAPVSVYCFYWSKIQNLKANHNRSEGCTQNPYIAFTGQRYKIWKQITTHAASKLHTLAIAFTGQRYKIWKQITTNSWNWSARRLLLLLVKDTKFESKSQRGFIVLSLAIHCFYWSKIQNLKANHNRSALY